MPNSDQDDRGESSNGDGQAAGTTAGPTTGTPLGGTAGATGDSSDPSLGGETASTTGTVAGATGDSAGSTGTAGQDTGGVQAPGADAGLAQPGTEGSEPVDCLNCLDDSDGGAEESSCDEADACTQEVDLSGEAKSLDAGSMQLSSASVQWSPTSASALKVFVRGRDATGLPSLIVVSMGTPDGTPFAPGSYGPVPAVSPTCVGDSSQAQPMEANVEITSLDVGFVGALQLRGVDWAVAFDVEQPLVCEPPDIP